MESQPQNPEFRNNPENFHPCDFVMFSNKSNSFSYFGRAPDCDKIFQIVLKSNLYHGNYY